MPRIADTSALYAVLVDRDAHHDDAHKAFGQPDPVLVPSEVLVELAGLLTLRFGIAKARAGIADIAETPNVHVRSIVWPESAYRRFVNAEDRLSLVDNFVLQMAVEHQFPVWTYDRRLHDLAKALVGEGA